MESPRLGITGGIATGKSTLSTCLQELGWSIIDSDRVTHDLYRPGAAGAEILVDTFGPSILCSDQSVNRVLLGQIVFADSSKRELLNSRIHPLVRAEWQRQHRELSLSQPGHPVAIIIPLMFEAKTENWFESIACTACSPEEQSRRLGTRGYNTTQINQRLQAQWPLVNKMERSHIIVWNDGSHELLRAQATRLDSLWRPRYLTSRQPAS